MTGLIILLCVLNVLLPVFNEDKSEIKKYRKWLNRITIALLIINLISHFNILTIILLIIILYVLLGRDKTFYGRK